MFSICHNSFLESSFYVVLIEFANILALNVTAQQTPRLWTTYCGAPEGVRERISFYVAPLGAWNSRRMFVLKCFFVFLVPSSTYLLTECYNSVIHAMFIFYNNVNDRVSGYSCVYYLLWRADEICFLVNVVLSPPCGQKMILHYVVLIWMDLQSTSWSPVLRFTSAFVVEHHKIMYIQTWILTSEFFLSRLHNKECLIVWLQMVQNNGAKLNTKQ